MNTANFKTSFKSICLLLTITALCSCSGPESKTSKSTRTSESTENPAPADQSTGLLKNRDFSVWAGDAPKAWTPEPWAKVKLSRGSETRDGKAVIEVTPSGGHTVVVYQVLDSGTLHEGDVLEGSVWVKASQPDVSLMMMTVDEQNGKEERKYSKAILHPGDGQWHQLEFKWNYVPAIKETRFVVWADENASKPFFISDAKLVDTQAK